MLTRLLYLGYYIKTTNFTQLKRFVNFVQEQTGLSRTSLLLDVLSSSAKYNTSLLEYFQFHFYRLKDPERANYAGTGTMYEYQLVMNPKAYRDCLDNKEDFHREYGDFVQRTAIGLAEVRSSSASVNRLLANPSGKIVLKHSRGQCGWQVKVFESSFFKDKNLFVFMQENGFDLAEEYIVQHPDLMALSPSAVNTVRIITQLNAKDEVEILGARLRISQNSHVDNMASGNFAASIDLASGVVDGPGIYGDMTKPEVTKHPVTRVSVVGFQVPFWPEILAMVRNAALRNSFNRSIGWDIAVTKDGPELVEGNHDWCKLVWQLPVQQGLKPVLDRHLREFQNRTSTEAVNEACEQF